MLGCRGRRIGSGGDVGGDRLKQTEDVVTLGQLNGDVERDPSALVFAVSTLNLFVNALLDLAFKNTRTLRFVETDDFEDLSSIEPAVGTSPHDGDIVDDAFVDWHARVGGLCGGAEGDIERKDGVNSATLVAAAILCI